jgi:hypothetical protein
MWHIYCFLTNKLPTHNLDTEVFPAYNIAGT